MVGIFTATEASAIAVLYTLILGFWYKEIKIKDIPEILLDSCGTTAIVMLLIGASMSMSWVMSYENIPQNISDVLLGISDNRIVILLIIMVLNLCVGLCTPPVVSVLFVGVGIANTTIEKVVKPLLPLFLAMILALMLITYIPALSLWLPSVFGL